MSGKNTNRYRCHYFSTSYREDSNCSFDFMATNDKRARKYAKAWIRERNKRSVKLLEEKKVLRNDWKTVFFQYLSRITIEPVEKETSI